MRFDDQLNCEIRVSHHMLCQHPPGVVRLPLQEVLREIAGVALLVVPLLERGGQSEVADLLGKQLARSPELEEPT